MDEFGLGILQMMENAGRNLAGLALTQLGSVRGRIAILAGNGGNGGGGLCCGRHLLNRGLSVDFILDRPAEKLRGPAGHQWEVLSAAGVRSVPEEDTAQVLHAADLVLDALIGYSLQGEVRGRAKELILNCNRLGKSVIALDVPSGLDATDGTPPRTLMQAGTTLTLALPKTGLKQWNGDLFLADIGIPPEVFKTVGMTFEPFFGTDYVLRMLQEEPKI